MTFKHSHSLDRVRQCVAMACELFASAGADGSAVDQARVAILFDTAAARLPETTEPGRDTEQRAHVAARLLCHASRLVAELRFADWDIGETIAALVSAAAADLDALVRGLERQGEPDTAGAPA